MSERRVVITFEGDGVAGAAINLRIVHVELVIESLTRRGHDTADGKEFAHREKIRWVAVACGFVEREPNGGVRGTKPEFAEVRPESLEPQMTCRPSVGGRSQRTLADGPGIGKG